MNAEELEEMGPVDYVLVEWPDRQPNGEAAPLLLDLVEKGLIRIIDLAFIIKDEEGNAAGVDVSELGIEAFSDFEGASAGLVGDSDIEEAAKALEPGTAAALLVYENRWAAPFASAVRRSGGQLVASGRIPIQAIEAALDAVETG